MTSTTHQNITRTDSTTQADEPCSSTHPTKQVKKSVTFVPYTYVVLVPHLSDYTSQELSHLYLNRNDFSAIRKHTKKLIHMIEDGHDETDMMPADCVRGLEENMHAYHHNRRVVRRQLQAYITSQRKLASYCGEDKEIIESRIAQHCQRLSAPSADAARAVAICDALEVQSICFEDEQQDNLISAECDPATQDECSDEDLLVEQARRMLISRTSRKFGAKKGNDASRFTPTRSSLPLYRKGQTSVVATCAVPRIA